MNQIHFVMVTKEQFEEYLKGFVKVWTDYANYIIHRLTGVPAEAIQVCKDALLLLESDLPERFSKEIYDSPVVDKRILDEAEEFDKAMWRMRMLSLPVSDERRKELKRMGENCISLEKLLLEVILRNQGRLQ